MSRPQAQGDMFKYTLCNLLGSTNYGYVYVLTLVIWLNRYVLILAYGHGYVYIHTLEPICLYSRYYAGLTRTIPRPRKKQ